MLPPKNAAKTSKALQNAKRQAAWRERQAQLTKEALAAKGLPPHSPISNIPGQARWKAQHSLAQATLKAMSEEMHGYFDERSQRWQESERGETMAGRLEQLDELIAAVQELEMD